MITKTYDMSGQLTGITCSGWPHDKPVHATPAGECVCCGTMTFSRDDGQDDPRGFTGDAADASLNWEDLGPGEDQDAARAADLLVPLCSACSNTEGGYSLGVDTLERLANDVINDAEVDDDTGALIFDDIDPDDYRP